MTTTKKREPTGVKLMPVEIKAYGEKDNLEDGQFSGYASVFGNKDSYGDVVAKGAFLETLAQYGEKGSGIAAYWQHRMDDPQMNIGQTVEAYEDDHGLFVKVQLDLDNPNAAYTHKLIKEGRVKQMSFAFTVQEYGIIETEDDFYFELRKMDLHEVSVVPVGANQETELLAVKSMLSGVKAGKSVSAKNADLLEQAKGLIMQVLEGEGEDEEKTKSDSSGKEPKLDKTEEPLGAKVEDQAEVKALDSDPDEALALIALATAGVYFD